MTDARADVLVVGGGPAGATAAFRLASFGISVTLLDRATFPREKICGESLSPGAVARLGAAGMWTPRVAGDSDGLGVRPLAMPIRGMRIRSPRGTVFFGRYKTGPGATGLALRRRVFDSELLESARERGVRVIEGVEVLAGEATANGARVHARTPEGASLRYEAKRVVVADGRQSHLARELGFLERTPGRGSRRYAVRAHCEAVAGLSNLAEMHVGVGGYCGVAPLSATSANICYVLLADHLDMTPQHLEMDFRRHLQAWPEVSQRLEGSRLLGPIGVSGPLRLVSPRQSRGPFIACGDTTGFLDPFTGEGIAHAIATGDLGAASIKASLAGRRQAFHEYEAEVRSSRRVKGFASSLLYGLVTRPALADKAAVMFSKTPRLADALVRLFGDQV